MGAEVLLMDPMTGAIRIPGDGEPGDYTRNNSVSPPAVTFSPDGRRLVTGGGEATVWDLPDMIEIMTFAGHGRRGFLGRYNVVTALAYAPDGRTIASGDAKGKIMLWDSVTGRELLRFKAHKRDVRSLAFSPDGLILASADRGTSVRLWDVSTGSPLATLDRDTSDVYSAAFSPDGGRLAVYGGKHVEIWRSPSGKGNLVELEQVFLLPYRNSIAVLLTPCVEFSPDGNTLAAIDGAATLIFLEDGTITPSFGTNVWDGSFSPDGRHLVTVGSDGVHLWGINRKSLPQ